MRTSNPTPAAQGSALLAVLWLSAALATIAISLADTVRGEAERSATAVDGLRSQDLAIGGLRRAILYMDWGRTHPDNPVFKPPAPFFVLDFPEGQTVVDVLPEDAKFDINAAVPGDLFNLLVNLGVDAARAQDITAAIVDWRAPPPGGSSPFDDFYASRRPPYRAAHARFQEIEELLSVVGVTPDLFYGTWQPAAEGSGQHLALRTGLADCVSVFGATRQFDVNTAAPAVLAAIGIPPEGVAALVQQRRAHAFLTQTDLAPFAEIEEWARRGEQVLGPSAAELFPSARNLYPDAAILGRLAAARRDFVPGEKLEPIYLRETAFKKAPPPRVI